MIVDCLDSVDFGQQLGIGGLREQRRTHKKADKRDSGSHEHGRVSSRLARERVNLSA
jgi:hypothetical protein